MQTAFQANAFQVSGFQIVAEAPAEDGGTVIYARPFPNLPERIARFEIDATERRDVCRIRLEADWSDDDSQFYLVSAEA